MYRLGASNRVDVPRRTPIDKDACRLTIPDEDTCPSADVNLVSVPNQHAGANITIAEHADPGQEASCGRVRGIEKGLGGRGDVGG